MNWDPQYALRKISLFSGVFDEEIAVADLRR
jgi:hypothetical protein